MIGRGVCGNVLDFWGRMCYNTNVMIRIRNVCKLSCISNNQTERKMFMKVDKKTNGKKLTVAIEGRVDTTTAPELEKEIKGSIENISDLVLDFEKVEYISSAGLRVLLSTQKIMNRQGEMSLINVSSDIMEILDVTGFSDILTIK